MTTTEKVHTQRERKLEIVFTGYVIKHGEKN